MTTTTPKFYQVSEFCHPDEPINIIIQQRTMTTTYSRWCEREIARWKATNDRECWAQENSEGLIALFAHAEYQKPVEAEGAQ
jgi:hypothetical protein